MAAVIIALCLVLAVGPLAAAQGIHTKPNYTGLSAGGATALSSAATTISTRVGFSAGGRFDLGFNFAALYPNKIPYRETSNETIYGVDAGVYFLRNRRVPWRLRQSGARFDLSYGGGGGKSFAAGSLTLFRVDPMKRPMTVTTLCTAGLVAPQPFASTGRFGGNTNQPYFSLSGELLFGFTMGDGTTLLVGPGLGTSDGNFFAGGSIQLVTGLLSDPLIEE